jgi:hypothetical protein
MEGGGVGGTAAEVLVVDADERAGDGRVDLAAAPFGAGGGLTAIGAQGRRRAAEEPTASAAVGSGRRRGCPGA